MPLHKRPFWYGIMGAGEVLAIMAGPVVAGGFAGTIGWPWCFWVNLPIMAVLIIVIIILAPRAQSTPRNTKPHRHLRVDHLKQFDPVGGLLLCGSIACLTLALNSAGALVPWTNPEVLAPLLVSIGLLIVAAFHQHKKGEGATFPVRLLWNWGYSINLIYTFLQAGSQQQATYYVSSQNQYPLGRDGNTPSPSLQFPDSTEPNSQTESIVASKFITNKALISLISFRFGYKKWPIKRL